MNTTRFITPALLAVFLTTLVGCATEDPAAEPTPMETTQEHDQEATSDPSAEAAADDVITELGAVHDFGDGVTIAMVDLRREIAKDGFNAVTGEEGDLPYVAWSWELTNNSGAPLTIGGETSSCFVGDPLAEAEQPVLGDSVNPPDMVADGQTATWDADCWMAEDQTALQYTLDLHGADQAPMYTVMFAGDVPA